MCSCPSFGVRLDVSVLGNINAVIVVRYHKMSDGVSIEAMLINMK
jgi:hypothetical protein